MGRAQGVTCPWGVPENPTEPPKKLLRIFSESFNSSMERQDKKRMPHIDPLRFLRCLEMSKEFPGTPNKFNSGTPPFPHSHTNSHKNPMVWEAHGKVPGEIPKK